MLKKLLAFPPVALGLDLADSYGRFAVARSSAALAYFLVLTLFPFLVCVNYFIGLLHLDLEQVIRSLDQVLPAAALNTMLDYLGYVSASQSPALLYASLLAIVLGASAGLRTLLQSMDELYGVTHVDPFRRLVLSIVLSILFIPTVYLSVLVILTGDWFFRFLEAQLPHALTALVPLGALSELWRWVKYLLLFAFVLLLVLGVYRLGIPRGGVSRRALLGFSTLTALAMVACSVLFSWFIGMSSRYALIYGSLASLIILLVWLYFCGNILLMGAVLCRTWTARRRS